MESATRTMCLVLALLAGCKRYHPKEAIATLDAIAKGIPVVPLAPPRCVETVPNSACNLTPEERLEEQNGIRSGLAWCRAFTIESAVTFARQPDLVREVARDPERARLFVELSAADQLGLTSPSQRAEFADVLHAYELQVTADLRTLCDSRSLQKQIPLVPDLDRLTDAQVVRLRELGQNAVTHPWRKLRPLRFLDGESIDDADMAGPSP